jgi:butyryl-CoA dehydrogenase
MNLSGKVAVITGAGSGLGLALVEELYKFGCKLFLADINQATLTAAKNNLNCPGLLIDVRSKQKVQDLGTAVVDHFGTIDIWINNAGIWMPHTPIPDLDWLVVEDLMAVNFFGLAYGSETALNIMKPKQSGIIVNIISIRALEVQAETAGYAASKFAADGFTKTLRLEAKDSHVDVIAIYPSRMKTNIFGESKPADWETFMEPSMVANKIIENIQKDKPEAEQIIKQIK